MKKFMEIELPRDMLENPDKYPAFWERYGHLFVRTPIRRTNGKWK